MARRSFSVIDVVEIFRHWQAERSRSEIARALGLDRKTVRKYVAKAEAAGLTPGAPLLSPEEWRVRVKEWFPELHDPRARSSVFGEIAVHREYIEDHLETNTVATIHQRLRDEKGLEASVASLRRYIRTEFPDREARARLTVLKDDPPPGEEAQVDYGYLGLWPDPKTARRHRVWAFIMVLAASRHIFVYPVLRMTERCFVEAHLTAFEFFGGVPRRLVCDNLKTGVMKPDLYDPRLNRTYQELSVHYGFLVDPARAAHPKDKPRVERPVGYVRDSFFSGREFTSLENMRAAAVCWCLETAGERRCRPLGGAAPYAVFLAAEKEELLPLPRQEFVLATWLTPKVAPDAHIAVEGSLYSVPYRLIGRRLDVRATDRNLFCFLEGELIKTHVRVGKGRRSTDFADYPPDKVAFLMKTPAWCRRRARELGPAVTQVVEELLTENVLHKLRAAQGILGLAERYGPERLAAAADRALEVGDPSYRTIRGILKRGREVVPVEEAPLPEGPAHLHGPDTLFAHLEVGF